MYIGSGLVTLMCQVVLLVGIKKRKSQRRITAIWGMVAI